MIRCIHGGMVSLTPITPSTLEVEGLERCSIGTRVNSLKSLLLASFGRASTRAFSTCVICANSKSSKAEINYITNFRYATMLLSLAKKLPLTWLTTS